MSRTLFVIQIFQTLTARRRPLARLQITVLAILVMASTACQYNDLKSGAQSASRPGSSGTAPGPGSVGASPAPAVVDYQLVREQILVPHCLRCHSNEAGGVQRGGVALNTFALAQPIAASIAEQIETDQMPLRAPPLTGELKALIRAWVDGGAVEVAPASGVRPRPMLQPESELELEFEVETEPSTEAAAVNAANRRPRRQILEILSTGVGRAEAKSVVAPIERKLGLEDSKLEFLAIGRPSFLKIRGEGAKPEAEITILKEMIQGSARVDLRSLKTGIELRDQHMHERYAQTDKYPTAELSFKLNDAQLGERMTNSKDDFESSVTGRLSWRERERDLPIQLRRRNGKMEAEFSFLLSDYGIDIPQYAGIKVANEIQVKVSTQVRELEAKK
jgi:hypothetical protein